MQKGIAMAASKIRKRDNNEGSIRQRADGRWEGRFILAYEADGTPIRRSLYASSRKELQEKLKDVLQKVQNDEYIPPQSLTVPGFAGINCGMNCGTSRKGVPILQDLQRISVVFSHKNKKSCIEMQDLWWSIPDSNR